MKKFLGLIIVQVVLLIFLLPILNYTIDLYGVFGRKVVFEHLEPNQHSLKLNFILNGKHNNSGLIFSNSRGGILNYSNQKNDWYNMSYSMGTPEEFLIDIENILKFKKKIKKIVVFIDETTLFEDYKRHKNQLIRKRINLNSKLETIPYLFSPFNFSILRRMILPSNRTIVFDIYNTGSYIEKNFKYENKRPNCYNVILKKDSSKVFREKLSVLKKIQELCLKNDVELKFFNHPISSRNYESSKKKIELFLNFLDYININGIHSISVFDCSIVEFNDNQWRDISHYNNSIGEIVESRVFKEFTN